MKEVRTRFAPSPTGYMHIGNLRTALYTYLIAKKNNGDFILRIEDTDQERYIEGAVDIIYDTLKTVGINWDEGPDIGGDFGPYIQSERRDLYKEYAEKIVENDHAYYCFCSKDRLDELRHKAEEDKIPFKYDGYCSKLSKEEVQKKLDAGEKYVIRQKVPTTGKTIFDDKVFGTITVENTTLDDQILIKSDGLPTYNFANVIDDHLMGITHIVRGSEYLSSTPKYNLLYEAFGWDKPTYIHVSPIMKSSSKKLSKREGDVSFADFINKGYLKEAVINYIALLGWSPAGEEEIFTMDELIEKFSIGGISKSPAIFDINKLNWVNSQYIKKASIERLTDIAMPHLRSAGLVGEEISESEFEWIKRIVSITRERLSFVGEIAEHVKIFFDDDIVPENDEAAEVLKGEQVPQLMSVLIQKIEEAETIDIEFGKGIFKIIQKETGIKGKNLFMPIRVALTGQVHGPEMYDIIDILGKEKMIFRLKKIIGK